ncbi:MAG: hypothetical protein Q8918_02375 [Bacteroidota bacterium]|nr:hypothetical protein [Bacteroidota bacterium]
MIFSDSVRNKAIVSISNEFAWKLQDVYEAIKELTDNGYAILGGDVWAVMSKQSGNLPLTYISPSEIAVGIIRGRNGVDYVFNWYSNKIISETWEDFVKRAKEETITSIRKLNAEQVVADEFKENIYYNLVYTDQVGYAKLK